MTSLVRELGKNIVSLIGITESHLMGCEVTRVEDALVLHSGNTQMINGVAVVLRLFSWNLCCFGHQVSDRIVMDISQ